MTTRLAAIVVYCGVLASILPAADPQPGLRVPEGFRVELYAGDNLAHDIFSMTIDSTGRVVVAGKDYVKILHDDDQDGLSDRATLFSDVPKSGAHGMCFDGNDLICTGDNSVMRLRDADGNGQADGAPEIWAVLKHAEHGANGVIRGPDGWFYVACGNDAGVSTELARTPTSPVTKPECGAIIRFSPDGKHSEIVAHGFRNIYDADFNAAGRLFTVDSDGERDQYLPWYTPTRLFDVKLSSAARVRALEVLSELWDAVSADLVNSIFAEGDDLLKARAISLLARATPSERSIQLLTKATRADVPDSVRRAAWETAGRIDRLALEKSSLVTTALAEASDQRLRTIALWAVRDCTPPPLMADASGLERIALRRLELARGDSVPPTPEFLALLVEAIRHGATVDERMEAVRVAQLELGDVCSEPTEPPIYAGYVANHPERIPVGEVRAAFVRALIDALPGQGPSTYAKRRSEDEMVAYEVARLLGMLEAADARVLVEREPLRNGHIGVEDSLHYLIVLSRLPGARKSSLTDTTAWLLLRLHDIMASDSQYPSRNWPTRVIELFQQLQQRDPNLGRALVASPDFGIPEHSFFVLRLPVADRPTAARRMIEYAKKQIIEHPWTVDFVEVLSTLPADECLPLLRTQWGDFMLRDSIALVLARHAQPADRGRLVESTRGADAAAWTKRLASIEWTKGNADQGKSSYEKRSCARCHRAADRLGPDLAGAASRFSPQDLFVAIIDPNRDVAPLYQTSQVITRSGKVYQGLVVYESPESTLVQTTPDDTVRVTGDEIIGIRKSRQSLMPVGLLNTADDEELADLHAYLKTLRAGR